MSSSIPAGHLVSPKVRLLLVALLLVGSILMALPPPAANAGGGGTWVVHDPGQLGTGGLNWLNGVALEPNGDVWAVGQYSPTAGTSQSLILRHTYFGSWVASTLDLPGYHRLLDVISIAPDNAWAVGEVQNPTTGTIETLVVHWNGVVWSRVTSANPGTGAFWNVLNSITVDTNDPTGIWAAGSYTDLITGASQTLVEKWDSTSSSFVNVPTNINPSAMRNVLNDIAVRASNDVWATGYYGDSSGDYELVMRMNGSTWTQLTPPQPPAGNRVLQALTVDPQGQVRLVGSNTTSNYHPLFYRWISESAGWTAPLVQAEVGSLESASTVQTSPDITWMKDIWAVGWNDSERIVEHNDAVSWEYIEAVPALDYAEDVAVRPIGIPGGQEKNFSASEAWVVGASWIGGAWRSRALNYRPPQTPPAPTKSTSRYVQVDSETKLRNLGCNQRTAGESGVVVLAFGAPRNWGTSEQPDYGTILTGSSIQVNIAKIKGLVRAFADGYTDQTCASAPGGQPHITIAVGTSNDIQGTPSTNALHYKHGLAWGEMINELHHLHSTPMVSYASAMDIEQGQSEREHWSGPDEVKEWLDGYADATFFSQRPNYNFGSCNGCDPWGPMPSPWTMEDVYEVSEYLPRASVIPQIYYFGETTPMAEQWRRASLIGMDPAYGRPIFFDGAMTESQDVGSNTPSEGWQQLWQALNFDPTGRTSGLLPWSTDITDNNSN